jgi:uncharacterized repeat protein (TIGR03803 family)
MKEGSIARLAAGLVVGLACGTALPGRAVAGIYEQLYSFKGGVDGEQPVGKLTILDNVLYGATSAGGGKCACGTVYRLSATGAHHVIHKFTGAPADGSDPEGGVITLGGMLYGTTARGGAAGCPEYGGCGTVFSMTSAGADTVLHGFSQKEGAAPGADLLVRGNSLWGTTSLYGGVFETLPTGKTRFFDPPPVYYFDDGGLVDVDGTLYGAAFSGFTRCQTRTGGSLYAITTAGKASTVHAFQCGADGYGPEGTLAYANGFLYGTTQTTIFSLSVTGSQENVIYTFGGADDAIGGGPGLTGYHGNFYGVSRSGGGTGCGGAGCGTIYYFNLSGVYGVIYRFQGGVDGAFPNGRLLLWHNSLYGVTAAGGSGTKCGTAGCGTVFRFTPVF